MGYSKRVAWKDHVVTRPRTYSETVNADGTKTLTPSEGTVIQQGTPQSADNFNAMDEALQHIGITLDMFMTMAQAELRAPREGNKTLEVEILTTDWVTSTEKVATVAAEGVRAGQTVIVAPEPSAENYDEYSNCGVRCIAQGTGTLTFAAEREPTTDLTVNVLIVA